MAKLKPGIAMPAGPSFVDYLLPTINMIPLSPKNVFSALKDAAKLVDLPIKRWRKSRSKNQRF